MLGAVLGYVAAHLLRWAEREGIVERGAFLAYTIALSILVLGAAKLIGVDGVLAAFVAGIAYRMVKRGDKRDEEQNIQIAMSHFLVLSTFVLIGLVAPWGAWWELGWRGVALCLLILFLRRLPWIYLLRGCIPAFKMPKEVWFVGWFGPIGVSTAFYAMLAVERTGYSEAWTVGSLVIFTSLLAHGWTATPLTRRFGRAGPR